MAVPPGRNPDVDPLLGNAGEVIFRDTPDFLAEEYRSIQQAEPMVGTARQTCRCKRSSPGSAPADR